MDNKINFVEKFCIIWTLLHAKIHAPLPEVTWKIQKKPGVLTKLDERVALLKLKSIVYMYNLKFFEFLHWFKLMYIKTLNHNGTQNRRLAEQNTTNNCTCTILWLHWLTIELNSITTVSLTRYVEHLTITNIIAIDFGDKEKFLIIHWRPIIRVLMTKSPHCQISD